MRRSSYFAPILALVLASVLAPTSTAQKNERPQKEKEIAEAQAFQHLQVPGSKVSRAVKKLRKLKWFSNLPAASQHARMEKKPILWIQALGTLKGQT